MHRLLLVLLPALLSLLTACRADDGTLGPARRIAPGVRLYTLSDSSLLDPPGPVAIQILRLDPGRIRLLSALAMGEVMGTETVGDIAKRHGAIAAVNAGFFLPNGDPAGVLQVDGVLVSDTPRQRGAVAVDNDDRGRTTLAFDVVAAVARVTLDRAEGKTSFPIGGIDTVRQRGRLMLFTPKYHNHTDTARRGIEWVIDGRPLTVRERREDEGSTPIPDAGFVLSYGGLDPPPPLDSLAVGDEVTLERRFATRHGTASHAWEDAEHVIGGAGLLMRNGRPVEDWAIEDLRAGFTTERHPRTIIGTDRARTIWLVTVDGRNPAVSLGMTFAELQRLASRLNLTDALNLDGGGSTTMVVGGEVVNHPSDAAGPRKVSDAILVHARDQGR